MYLTEVFPETTNCYLTAKASVAFSFLAKAVLAQTGKDSPNWPGNLIALCKSRGVSDLPGTFVFFSASSTQNSASTTRVHTRDSRILNDNSHLQASSFRRFFTMP